MTREDATEMLVTRRGGGAGWPVVLLGLVLGCGGGGGGTGTGTGRDGGSTHALVVQAASPPNSLVMGESTQLSTQATDPDGDNTLTYRWAQTAPASPQGSFSSLTSANPTWTAPTVSAATRFTLSVTVSDGHGDTGIGTATVYAKNSTDPSFLADVQPLLVLCFGSCHTAPSGVQPLTKYTTLVNDRASALCSGEMYVKPGDPENSVLFKSMAGTSCGEEMPPGGPFLGTDQVNLVRTWISQGAAND